MPRFAYEARNDDGQLLSGLVTARDVEEAGEKLSRQGLFVVRLGVDGGEEPTAPGKLAGAHRHKVKRAKVMWVLNQLAIMIQTGITVGESLEVLARQARDPAMKQVLTGVSTAVQEGRPVSDAMDAYPRTFPMAVTAMIRASEASGTLGLVLTRVSQYMLKDEQALQRLRGALMYPAFIFVMCVSVTLFLITVILPKFTEMYATRGATLPLPTRLLMGTSDFVTGNAAYLVGGLLVVAAGLYLGSRTARGQALRDRALLRMPLMGELFNKLYQSRAFRSIGTLLDVGVPLSDVLILARNMSSNTCYKQLWHRVHEGVTNGQHIATPMNDFEFIPESIRHMIECGDRTGKLGPVFASLADFIEEEYDRTMKTVTQLLEPLMILFMGGIIGVVAIALLLPMFGAANVVAK